MSRKIAEKIGDKVDYSKKIIKLLADKPAVSIERIMESMSSPHSAKATRGAARSLKGLHDSGLIERHHSGQQAYARLTSDGRKKALSIKLDAKDTLVDPTWDGKWRIILLDLPEERKAEREGLRYLLKKAGFVCLKNSVWISMHPFEHFFASIKKDLGLTTEIMIFVTTTLDKNTEEEFLKLAK